MMTRKNDLSKDLWGEYNRRDFLKASAAALAVAAFPGLSGCMSLPRRELPDIDYSLPLVLKNCKIVDSHTGEIHKGDITIAGGKIQAIGTAPLKMKGATIDLENRYIIPGLIDSHVHLTLQSCGNFRFKDLGRHAKQVKNNFIMQVEAGVTTVRDMGSFPKLLQKHLKSVSKGSLIGPRVVHCNAIANVDGGHPEVKSTDLSVMAPLSEAFTGKMTLDLKNSDDIEEKLTNNLKNGASFIKLTMDDRSLMCGNGQLPVYSKDQMKKIFSFADKENKPVAGHVLMKYGFTRSLEYPMHSVEHIASDVLIADREIEKMAKMGLAIVPTIIISHNFAFKEIYGGKLPKQYRTDFIENELSIKQEYFSSDLVEPYDPYLNRLNIETVKWLVNTGCDNMFREKQFMTNPKLAFGGLTNGVSNLVRMRDAGILIGCGTDAGVPLHYHGALWREMEMLSRIGFSNKEILRMVTVDNAKIIGMTDVIGTIEKYKYADLVVLDKNPLKDITSYRKPLMVIKDGSVQFVRNKLEMIGKGKSYSIS